MTLPYNGLPYTHIINITTNRNLHRRKKHLPTGKNTVMICLSTEK